MSVGEKKPDNKKKANSSRKVCSGGEREKTKKNYKKDNLISTETYTNCYEGEKIYIIIKWKSWNAWWAEKRAGKCIK